MTQVLECTDDFVGAATRGPLGGVSWELPGPAPAQWERMCEQLWPGAPDHNVGGRPETARANTADASTETD